LSNPCHQKVVLEIPSYRFTGYMIDYRSEESMRKFAFIRS